MSTKLMVKRRVPMASSLVEHDPAVFECVCYRVVRDACDPGAWFHKSVCESCLGVSGQV